MYRISNIKIAIKNDGQLALKKAICKKLNSKESDIINLKIVKKSIDARKKHDVHFVYTVDVLLNKDIKITDKSVQKTPDNAYIIPNKVKSAVQPIICGTGPAGLFAGLVLARCGLSPILLEQGEDVDQRVQSVEDFWKNGKLNPNSNVQFGEGGAGTFSDGKLTSGIKDNRCGFILSKFVKFGAPEEIEYSNKPHIGTDKLRGIVKNMRQEILSLGGEVRFNTKLTNIIIKNDSIIEIAIQKNGKTDVLPCTNLILAIGHSSRDTFQMLVQNKVALNAKPFAVGFRIEHLQKWLNSTQYGSFSEQLPAADYKLFTHLPNGRTVYTFCMCPGGMVVGATSEDNTVVVNGMSNYTRDGLNCNSALLCEIRPDDFKSDNPLAGMHFQQQYERIAFLMGGSNYNAPASLLGDFLTGKVSQNFGEIIPTYQPAITLTDLHECLPKIVIDSIIRAIPELDRKLNGFANPDAVLTGVETRTSSPVRILRDNSLQSNIRGIYPCGEGAGYAGGIMSAAVDGIKCAESIIAKL